MSRDPIVASNYAKALLHTAQKSGIALRAVLDEAIQLRRLIEAESRLRVFLEGPQFRDEDKIRIVVNVFKGRVSDLLFQFMLLVLQRDRIVHLFEIFDEFEYLVEREEGVTPGVVTTAVPITDEAVALIRTKLEAATGLKFDLRAKVDPKLIGGVKVQYKDVLIDSTIQTYLGDLRQRLMQTRLAS